MRAEGVYAVRWPVSTRGRRKNLLLPNLLVSTVPSSRSKHPDDLHCFVLTGPSDSASLLATRLMKGWEMTVAANSFPTVTTRFTDVTRKFQVGVGACAIAAAATLTPAVVAQADSMPSIPLAPVTDVLHSDLTLSPPNLALDGNLWWLGSSATAPALSRTPVFTFEPLALIPGFFKPLYMKWTQNWNFEACLAGSSVKIGPYGSVTVSIGRGC